MRAHLERHTHTAQRCRKRRGNSRQGCARTRISSMAMKPGWPWTETASKITCKSERKKISWDMSSSLTEDAGRTPAARVERRCALSTPGQQPPPGASLLRPSPLIFMQPPSPPSILILSILSSSDLFPLPRSFDTLHLHLFDSPLFFFLSFFSLRSLLCFFCLAQIQMLSEWQAAVRRAAKPSCTSDPHINSHV